MLALITEIGYSIKVLAVDPGLIDTGYILVETDPWSIVKRGVNTIPNPSEYDKSYIESGNKKGFGIGTGFADRWYNVYHKLKNPVQVNNAGVKKIVTDELLKLLDLYDEPIKTHHKDIRSASRILILGLKKEKLWKGITHLLQ